MPITANLNLPAAKAVGYGALNGKLTTPSLTLSAAGRNTGSSAGDVTVPAVTMSGSFGEVAFLTMGAVTASGTGTASGSGQAALTLPEILASGSGTASGRGGAALTMGAYKLVGYFGSVLSVTLNGVSAAATGTAGNVGRAAVELPMFDLVATGSRSMGGTADLVLPALQATNSGQIWVVAPGVTLVASGSAVVTATYEAYALNLKHSARRNPREAVVDEVSRYTNFPFDKVIRYKNNYFGVSATGMYLLDGTTDLGADIPWAVRTAITDFDTAQNKTVGSTYWSGRLGEAATISIHVGETGNETYSFTTPRGAVAQNYRQVFGRGLKARYFAVSAAGSKEFSLDALLFSVATLSRKI